MLHHDFLILALLGSVAMAQSTTSSVATTAAAVSSSTNTRSAISSSSSSISTISAAPTLALPTLGTLTACETTRINWQFRNADPASYTITFRAHNSGVDQAITSTSSASTSTTPLVAIPSSTPLTFGALTPLTSSSTAIAASRTSSVVSTTSTARLPARHLPSVSLDKRTKLSINQTLGTNGAGYGWSMPVTLPQGRYVLIATIPDLGISSSAPFTVLESSDTSCLAAFAAASSGTVTGSRTAQASGTSAASQSNGGGGTSAGAIAGGVIGALAVLAAIGLGLLYFLRRRRRANVIGANMREREKPSGPAMGGMGRSVSRPRRKPSNGGTGAISPPTSSSSHAGHFESSYPVFGAGVVAPSLGPSPRVSASSDTTPFGKSPDSTTTHPEGRPGDLDNPFATPLPSSHGHSTRADPFSSPRPSSTIGSPSRRPADPSSSTDFGPSTPAHPPSSAGAARNLSRSQSVSNGSRPSPPSSEGGVSRKGSVKRKPVPSLGPELRKQIDTERKAGEGVGAVSAGKKEFMLVPDLPGGAARALQW